MYRICDIICTIIANKNWNFNFIISKVYIKLDQPLTALDIYCKGIEEFPGETTLTVGKTARLHLAIHCVKNRRWSTGWFTLMDANTDAKFANTDHPQAVQGSMRG